jgi:hypothetical protein
MQTLSKHQQYLSNIIFFDFDMEKVSLFRNGNGAARAARHQPRPKKTGRK